MKNIFIFICITMSSIVFSQKNFTVEKWATTAKVWGFLKYYHPNVASGKFDWDNELISRCKRLDEIKNKEELSQFYLEWIDSLGTLKECKKCSEIPKKEFFDKNFDLGWLENKELLSDAVQKKMQYIEKNRFQGNNFYLEIGKEGNIKTRNEPKSDTSEYPDRYFRLLSLFKFWNSIEYFYPYKYLMDENWNAVLLEMIPKFNDAKSGKEYHLAMLETTVKLCDSHTTFKTKFTIDFFGTNFFPADLKIIDKKAVVIGFLNDSLSKINDLRIGDIITKIDGREIMEILNDRSKYIPASNANGKVRDTYYNLINGNTREVQVVLNRDGVSSSRLINRYSFGEIFKKSQKYVKFKVLENNIGYVNFASMDHKDIDELVTSLSSTKAIIFDLRNYPNIIPHRLSNFLNSSKMPFSKSILPDLTYPGKFFWNSPAFCGQKNDEYYKGQVIILVDQNTQSRGEYVAMMLQTAPKVTTIGNQTAGADGNISKIDFLGNYSSLISGTGVYYNNGTQTQRKGIKINILMEVSIEAIRQGRDEILEKAVQYCNNKI
jgi:carboxyl-terminal processing protease